MKKLLTSEGKRRGKPDRVHYLAGLVEGVRWEVSETFIIFGVEQAVAADRVGNKTVPLKGGRHLRGGV
jgi:hypothetical protein